MKATAYHAIIENGQVKLIDAVSLPEHSRVNIVVPDASGAAVLRVGSPKLADPERARDFRMEVSEEPPNAGLR